MPRKDGTGPMWERRGLGLNRCISLELPINTETVTNICLHPERKGFGQGKRFARRGWKI